MSERASGPADLMASIAAFGRVLYTDLLTVVVVSVLFTLTSLPLVTVGASLLATTEVVTAVVTGENRGGPTTERERASLYVDSFREHLRAGLPYSVVLVLVAANAAYYGALTLSFRSPLFLLGSLVGVYAVVVAPVWLLRAASIAIRTDDDVGFWPALREGAYLALEQPSYSVLHLCTAAVVLLCSGLFPLLLVVFLPGALALLEVVTFEELTGRGAKTIVRAYRGVFE